MNIWIINPLIPKDLVIYMFDLIKLKLIYFQVSMVDIILQCRFLKFWCLGFWVADLYICCAIRPSFGIAIKHNSTKKEEKTNSLHAIRENLYSSFFEFLELFKVFGSYLASQTFEHTFSVCDTSFHRHCKNEIWKLTGHKKLSWYAFAIYRDLQI